MKDLKGLKLNEIEIKESDLDEFAKDFVTKLSIPSVIGFNGSLGAGKTSIIKKIIYYYMLIILDHHFTILILRLTYQELVSQYMGAI